MQNKGFVGIMIAQTLSQLFVTKSADLLSADFGIFKKIYVKKGIQLISSLKINKNLIIFKRGSTIAC